MSGLDNFSAGLPKVNQVLDKAFTTRNWSCALRVESGKSDSPLQILALTEFNHYRSISILPTLSQSLDGSSGASYSTFWVPFRFPSESLHGISCNLLH